MNEPTTTTTQTPGAFYTLLGLVVFLAIVMLAIFFDWTWKPLGKHSTEQLVANILMMLFFSLLVVGVCVLFLPSLREVKHLFAQISNVSYVMLFTVGALLLYTNLPSQTLKEYAYLINPVILVVGAFAFYQGLRENVGSTSFSVPYERIKMFLMLLCFLTLMAMVYFVNPGNLATYLGGTGMLLSILLGVFALLYVLVLTTSANQPGAPNLLSNFSSFGVYGTLGFVVFLGIVTSLLVSDTKMNSAKQTSILILMLVSSVLWMVLLGAHTMGTGGTGSIGNAHLKHGLSILLGLVLSGLLIYTLAYYIGHSANVTSIVLNMLLIAILLGLLHKTVFVKLPVGNAKKNALIQLVSSTLFYLPCLLNSGFDKAGQWATGQQGDAGSWMMLLVAICLLTAYFRGPSLLNQLSSQGGKQLVLQPIHLDKQTTLGSYLDLHGEKDKSKKYDYQYALSCWVYLDAMPPNTNPHYNTYTPLLDFGGKPRIAYHARANALKVTMLDKEGREKLVYKQVNVLLQKWNHIIVNYSGGTLDIFLNGQLVKSKPGVVPYYTYDTLTIGENDGVKGGMCNVVYFDHALNASNVYTLYHSVQGRNPPLLGDDGQTQLVNKT